MKLRRISPAALQDMAQLGGASTRVQWAVLREMWSGGKTWSVYAGGEIILLAGLYPLDDGGAEAWFNVQPPAAEHMLPLARLVRLTLRSEAYGSIATICRTQAGKRFARAVGFEFSGSFGGGLDPDWELWTWRH